MTITVELTADLRPWRKGDNVPLPDFLADKLVASGEAINPRPGLSTQLADVAEPAPTAPAAPRRRTYLTKGR